MALNPVDREANAKDSIKKYLVDSLEVGESIPVIFDTELTIPNTTDPTVKKWVTVIWGNFNKPDKVNYFDVTIYCCVREDREGFIVTQLRDKVMGYMVDSEQTDGTRRVTLYKSHPTQPWEILGGMMVKPVRVAGDITAPDGTKYKRLIFEFMWGGE